MSQQGRSASRPKLGEGVGWVPQTCTPQTWGSLHATRAPAVWLRTAFSNPRKLLSLILTKFVDEELCLASFAVQCSAVLHLLLLYRRNQRLHVTRLYCLDNTPAVYQRAHSQGFKSCFVLIWFPLLHWQLLDLYVHLEKNKLCIVQTLKQMLAPGVAICMFCGSMTEVLDACRWVDGELLHFSGDGVTTRGAELGFVWTGNQNHFLIVLKRVDLSEEDE